MRLVCLPPMHFKVRFPLHFLTIKRFNCSSPTPCISLLFPVAAFLLSPYAHSSFFGKVAYPIHPALFDWYLVYPFIVSHALATRFLPYLLPRYIPGLSILYPLVYLPVCSHNFPVRFLPYVLPRYILLYVHLIFPRISPRVFPMPSPCVSFSVCSYIHSLVYSPLTGLLGLLCAFSLSQATLPLQLNLYIVRISSCSDRREWDRAGY